MTRGRNEISNLIVPQDTPGFTRSKTYRKMGWRASDTRELSFADAEVPEENLLGVRGEGLRQFLTDPRRRPDLGRGALGGTRRGRVRRSVSLRAGAAPVRPADLAIPGDPVQAGRHEDGDRACQADDPQGRLGKRSGPRVHPERELGEALFGRGLAAGGQRGGPDPRRLRLHGRVSGLAHVSRPEDQRDRRGDQ